MVRHPGAITVEALPPIGGVRGPGDIHATCEDYRAGAGVDVAHDAADRDQGRRISAPVLLLWGQPAGMELPFDPLVVWRRRPGRSTATPWRVATSWPERPDEIVDALQRFLS